MLHTVIELQQNQQQKSKFATSINMELKQSLLESTSSEDSNKNYFKTHNILFTKINQFIKILKTLAQDQQLSNKQIDPFIAQSTSVDVQLEKLEKYIQGNRQHFQSTNFDLFKIKKQMTGLTLLKGFFLSITNEILSASGIFMLDFVTDQLKDFTAQEQREEKEDTTSSQKVNPDINNLLTVDVEESMQLFWGINQLVASLAVIIITFAIIYYKIGKSIINGLYLMAGAMAVSFLSRFFMNIFYDGIYSHKDSRISLCKDVIEGIKSIKYLGWQNIFSNKIKDLRQKEFINVTAMRSIDGIFSTFMVCSNYFLLYCFIVSYINDGNELINSNVFTIIALFGNLAFPIGMIPFSLKCITKARISLDRIKIFLNIDEINESEGNILLSQFSYQPKLIVIQMHDNSVAVQIQNQYFFWSNKELNVVNKAKTSRRYFKLRKQV
ncbi:hypothetical protein ABPG72_000550 [Tetrahymena utriculariae]